MNRQSRRHPGHPLLPALYPSKKRLADKPASVSVSTEGKGFIKRSLRRDMMYPSQ